jgi:hypothetical protein
MIAKRRQAGTGEAGKVPGAGEGARGDDRGLAGCGGEEVGGAADGAVGGGRHLQGSAGFSLRLCQRRSILQFLPLIRDRTLRFSTPTCGHVWRVATERR